jgi:uncharacterized protein with GYD domain
MAFYLWTGNYTREAMKAMVKRPQNREAVARKSIESAGGKLHHAFIALGTSDIVVVAEFPDDATAAAVTLAVGAAGAVTNAATTKLMTFADFAEAQKKAGKIAATYKPPQG